MLTTGKHRTGEVHRRCRIMQRGVAIHNPGQRGDEGDAERKPGDSADCFRLCPDPEGGRIGHVDLNQMTTEDVEQDIAIVKRWSKGMVTSDGEGTQAERGFRL